MFTVHEFWTVFHGMVLGGVLLLVFPGAIVALWNLRSGWLTGDGLKKNLRLLTTCIWIIVIFAWLAVITGTYVPYPWYRAVPLAGADLTYFPIAYLRADPGLAAWEEYGMEWKEHVAWFSPILATAVIYVVTRYGARLGDKVKIRKAMTALLLIAFVTAGVAGFLGALITKVAPVR
jgi:hypothetical protein